VDLLLAGGLRRDDGTVPSEGDQEAEQDGWQATHENPP
jgi:hypothetical protein